MIGSHLGVRLVWIGHWSAWTVVVEKVEEKNLLASKRSSLLHPFTPASAGPFSSGLNIRTLLALSNSSRLIGRPPPPPPPSLEQEWARPFGMGRTDKPLLAVSIASKLLLQHDDSAIPGTMRTILTIVSIIQFAALSFCCQQIPSSLDNPLARNYSYLKLQQVAATILPSCTFTID